MPNKYVQNPDVVVREADDDGALLFNPDTNEIELLNMTGHFIWNFCAYAHTIGEIVAALKTDYEGVTDSELASDAEGFIDLMVSRGLIGVV